MKGQLYKDLPAHARKALWLYYKSGGTDPRTVRWGYAEVSLRRIVREMWKDVPKREREFDTFEDFYRSLSRESIPLWAQKDAGSVWAIIMGGPPGGPYMRGDFGVSVVLMDGWHRLSFYMRRYDPSFRVPIVWPILR